jgi:hypothetical protein
MLVCCGNVASGVRAGDIASRLIHHQIVRSQQPSGQALLLHALLTPGVHPHVTEVCSQQLLHCNLLCVAG